MEVQFLGTAAMIPTKERNQSGILIKHEGTTLLVDCGENMQRQLRLAEVSPASINAILITHWHGDHVLGLPGLLQTLSASQYQNRLLIIGPQGTKLFLNKVLKTFVHDIAIKIEVKEAMDSFSCAFEDVVIKAKLLKHNTITLGFRIETKEKRKMRMDMISKLKIPVGPLLGKLQRGKAIRVNGKKITANEVTEIIPRKVVSIVTDTLPCASANALALNADLFICEATYHSDLQEKAKEHYHMTSRDAATIAKKSNARSLVLTHFSQRYKDVKGFQKEASSIFPKVVCAEDLQKIRI